MKLSTLFSDAAMIALAIALAAGSIPAEAIVASRKGPPKSAAAPMVVSAGIPTISRNAGEDSMSLALGSNR